MKKKILSLSFLLMVALSASAQDTKKFQKYVAGSLSLTNGDDLGSATYFMVEGGLVYKNISFGIGAGRGSLKFPEKDDMTFIEPKTSVIFYESSFAKCYGIAGVGGYFFRSTPHYFIEYGAGIDIPLPKYDLMIQYSTWDGTPYISLGLSKTF